MLNERTLRVGGILSLLWSLMGIAAYVMQARMDLNQLAKSDPYQAHMFAQMPHWAWTAYAVAVWTELAGSILLLMRRRAAVWLFAVSLIAVLVQFGYAFTMTDLIAVKGSGAAVFPIIIIAVAILQTGFARAANASGLMK